MTVIGALYPTQIDHRHGALVETSTRHADAAGTPSTRVRQAHFRGSSPGILRTVDFPMGGITGHFGGGGAK